MPRRQLQPPTQSRLRVQPTDAREALGQGLPRHRHGREHGTRAALTFASEGALVVGCDVAVEPAEETRANRSAAVERTSPPTAIPAVAGALATSRVRGSRRE